MLLVRERERKWLHTLNGSTGRRSPPRHPAPPAAATRIASRSAAFLAARRRLRFRLKAPSTGALAAAAAASRSASPRLARVTRLVTRPDRPAAEAAVAVGVGLRGVGARPPAPLACAPRAAHAVEVADRVRRKLGLDDVRRVERVDAAGEDVRADEHADAPVREALQEARSLVVVDARMHSLDAARGTGGGGALV